MFLILIAQSEKSRDSSHSGIRNFDPISLLTEIKNIFSTVVQFSFLPRSIKNLYCDAPHYRVTRNKTKYNKYFDHLLESSGGNTFHNLIVDYKATSKAGYRKADQTFLLVNFSRWLRIFRRKYRSDKKDNKFAVKIDSILKEEGYTVNNLVTQLSKDISNVDRYVLVWNKILEKVNPNIIYQLCYYSPAMLGLNIVAHHKGIPTVDMQHGPQGQYHLAYGSWKEVPNEGYEALPDKFFTWDEVSTKYIKEWTCNTSKHSVVCTGNPWVEKWKRGDFKSSEYDWPKNIILYTLQPIGEPLEPYLLKAIKNTRNKWNWWLRLHPRQLEELEEVRHKLSRYGIGNSVNITDATNLPLPEILIHTKVHITKFSGCAIEAFEFGVPSILLDERGKDYFSDYLEYGGMEASTEKNVDVLIERIQQNF